jgi:hypothetical protein
MSYVICDTVLSWLATVKKIHNFDIKTIKCDNASENKTLLAEVNKNATLKIKFEITALKEIYYYVGQS